MLSATAINTRQETKLVMSNRCSVTSILLQLYLMIAYEAHVSTIVVYYTV